MAITVPSGNLLHSYSKWPSRHFVSFPIRHGGSFHSYVSHYWRVMTKNLEPRPSWTNIALLCSKGSQRVTERIWTHLSKCGGCSWTPAENNMVPHEKITGPARWMDQNHEVSEYNWQKMFTSPGCIPITWRLRECSPSQRWMHEVAHYRYRTSLCVFSPSAAQVCRCCPCNKM